MIGALGVTVPGSLRWCATVSPAASGKSESGPKFCRDVRALGQDAYLFIWIGIEGGYDAG